MPRLGVLGWPVAHSRSPAMHQAALDDAGLEGWRYQALPVPPGLFEETVCGLAEAGFAGANVTIPHKQAALAVADEATDSASSIGAANTLLFAGGRITADNTDAPGLLDALPAPPRGHRALVLGAGGAARAAVWALREAGATEITVWNRTPERAERLGRELGARPVRIPEPAALLVNATSVGMRAGDSPFDELPLAAERLGEFECVVDLVYREDGSETDLVTLARRQGASTVDGIEVLVCQGARSFEAWTGRRASLGVMRAAARTSA